MASDHSFLIWVIHPINRDFTLFKKAHEVTFKSRF